MKNITIRFSHSLLSELIFKLVIKNTNGKT